MTRVLIPVPPDDLDYYGKQIDDWLYENIGERYKDTNNKGEWCHGPYTNLNNGDLVRVYFIRDDINVMAVKLKWL